MFSYINGRLSFGGRLGLICSLFLAPILMLAALHAGARLSDIRFSTKELAGSEYLSEVWSAAVTSGPIADDGGRFGEGEALAAYSAASRDQKLAAGFALVTAVADGSNLTLDPDLDSFYVMDAATVRLPALYTAAHELEAALKAGSRDQIMIAADRLDVARQATASSLQASIRNNASGETGRALSTHAAELDAAAGAVVAGAQAVLAGQGGPPVSTRNVMTKADETWKASNAELGRLLEVRIAGLTRLLSVEIGLALAALTGAGILALIISRGLSGRVNRLVRAMDALSHGDVDVSVPCVEDRNETGRIAAALLIFREKLVERNALQAEAALVSQKNESRLREVEAAHQAAGRAQAEVVEALGRRLAALAEGDLTVRLTDPVSLEYEKVRSDFNEAVSRLQAAIREVDANTSTITSGANELALASDNLSKRTEQQAASLEETAAALDQITATVRKTADGARQASDTVAKARTDAEIGEQVMAEAVQAMAGIERSATEIGQIISAIDEIAFQTNLLALNAGVEAARAGEAGRGFAVVASEVRALAQRSADAAKQIKILISTSSAQVGQGAKLVAETGGALQNIIAQVAEIDSLVIEMAASAQEQATGLAQVNTAVNQMDQMTQQNAAMVEQSAAATQSLKSEAVQLSRAVGRFSTGERSEWISPSNTVGGLDATMLRQRERLQAVG